MNLKLATSNEKLTSARAARSPEREVLAAAIKAATEAERAAERGRSAVERATNLIAELENKLAAATAAVADAREQHGRCMAEAVTAGQASPTSALRAARAAETDVADDLDAARSALVRLQDALADLDADASRAGLGVDAALNAVLAAAAVPLVDELEQVKSKIPGLQACLHFIRTRGSVDHGAFSVELAELAQPLAEVAPRLTSAIELGLSFEPRSASQHPVAERWRSAVAALRVDPDAALPS